MQKLRDPSTVPSGGGFCVKHPELPPTFCHASLSVVYVKMRKYCYDNGREMPSTAQIEQWMCQQHPEWCVEKIKSINGAGDVVYAFAHPIAQAIDAVAGTNLANCQSCEERRRALNKAMPL